MTATIEMPLWLLALLAIAMIALLVWAMRGAADTPAASAAGRADEPARQQSPHRSVERASMKPSDRLRPGATSRVPASSNQTYHPGRSPLYTSTAPAGPDLIEAARMRAAGIDGGASAGGAPRSLAAVHALLAGREFSSMKDFAVAAVRDGGQRAAVIAPLFRIPIWRLEEWVAAVATAPADPAAPRDTLAAAPATGTSPRAMSARVAAAH